MSTPLHILIIEDSEDDALLTVRELKRRGYEPTFERVDTAPAMRAALNNQTWDAIIADYNMPNFSVDEALALLRESGLYLPFIIVSGSIGEETAVAAMKAGAHDYLMKDNLARLAPALERELREAEAYRQRKRAEEALRDSEAKLRLMFRSVPEGITVTDLEGKILEVNEATVEMHGYDNKEELIGKSAFELIVEEDRNRAVAMLRKTLEDRHAQNIAAEFTLLKKDGSKFPAELNGAPLKDGAGNPYGFIAVRRDITERKNMQEQLILADRLASVGELASGIAHELNNPLTGVIGLSQLLTQKNVPEDIREDLDLVYSEAQRAANVVKNLLTFARKHSPAKELIDVNEVVSKVLELRAYEERVNNIAAVTHLASDLPQIKADYFQLQQVFLNIIINAEHFMIETHGKGTLTITTEQAADWVRVSFSDDGPGISKEDLGHIFDPFFTTKEVGKGTGLGLSICHGIVNAHGGQLSVESEPDRGATFFVELPLSQEETTG